MPLPSTAPPSIWSVKPWWCQPWSIVATGLAVVAASLFWPGLWWLSLGLGLLITLWWWLFLVVVPTAWAREQTAHLK